MKIFLDVVGCRLNQSEVEGFANFFRALGHDIVGQPSEADLAIINTCAVTVKASADSRKKLRRAVREGTPKVIATGCWATLYPQRALALPGVTSVFPNDEKDSLVSTVLEIPLEDLQGLNLVRKPLPGERGRTRAFIKVQEGCDHHCAFCLTRLARGRSRSRSLVEIRRDIQAALAGDAKEIVLTGVQLGAWGRDLPTRKNLVDLLSSVLSINQIERLRLSSIEPWDLSSELIPLWEDARMCRQLHIPLQSGQDRILNRMARPITSLAFADLVNMIRQSVPDMAITTDVMVGFPGETETDFQATVSFVRDVGFSGGHVFTYSPRPGTAAVQMDGQISPQVAKARNKVLRNVFKEIGDQYRLQFLGKTRSVLWESSSFEGDGCWHLSGLTDNYIRVYTEAKCDLWNKISNVTFIAPDPQKNALIGCILEM